MNKRQPGSRRRECIANYLRERGVKVPENCLKCGAATVECWDERSLEWFDPSGQLSGIQIVSFLKCTTCGHVWTEVDPDDEVMSHDGNSPEYGNIYDDRDG